MTTSFVVLGAIFLQAIDLSRDMLIQAMEMRSAVSTLALAFALQQHDVLTAVDGILSLTRTLRQGALTRPITVSKTVSCDSISQ